LEELCFWGLGGGKKRCNALSRRLLTVVVVTQVNEKLDGQESDLLGPIEVWKTT